MSTTTDKLVIKSSDKDFDQYWVRIHGSPIGNVISADVEKGEVWVHDGVDTAKARELKTGSVTITKKREVEPQAPNSQKAKATAGRTSASRQSTSGA